MPRINTALAACIAPLALALALAGCHQPANETATTDAATAAPEAKPGTSLSDGRLVLPAVKGNPAAAYFTLANATSAPVTLAAVAVAGASKAEMHLTADGAMRKVDQVEVAPDAQLKFEPGSYHLMLFDLDPKLVAGETAELTVTFANGDKLSAPLKIEAVSGTGAMAGMGDMHMGDHH